MALLGVIVVSALGAATWLYWRTRTALPSLDGALPVAGLRGRVEVLRDTHGVPHLRAASLEDLIFAQGYVTAQDRLFQMDLSRRLAMGRLSEILGERMLSLDIENRTLGFPQVCERAVAEMDPESRKVLGAYAAGVNAFIASHRSRLPIEFLLLGYTPGPWREADSFGVALNMAKTLNTSWPDELMREKIRAEIPPELYPDLFPDHSALDHPVAEPVSAPVGAAGTPHAPLMLPPAAWAFGPLLAALDSPADGSAGDPGSNNWVVSGAHTQSGKPLLANDPHLPHSVPSVWYMIHLNAPGLDVSGVSLPGLPLVIIGHNQRIAWGVTNTGPDVQDLYVENFNFRDPNKYLHNNAWVEAQERQETVHVRGGSDYRFTVKVTRHGPVVSHQGDRDLALSWTAIEPHALRFPFLQIDRAGNWQEFTDALRNFTGPTQNFVYADVDGNIGYYAAGWIPTRKQGDGSVPSPGSTDDYDWTGYIPFEDLPHAYNPPSGMIATANGRVVPDGYPYFITHRWAEPFRTARIYQLLETGNRFTVEDMLRIQTDILSLEDQWLARELLAAAKARPPAGADARYALTLLENWDGVARADSAATLVCELTRHALLRRILRPRLGDDLSGYNWSMSTVFLQNLLANNWTRWLPPGDTDFNATLMESLEHGVGQIPAMVGSHDRSAWQWGKTIPLTFRNRLSIPFPFLGSFLNVGPVPQAGTQTTVKQTTSTLGPSMRMVVDFSDFEKSVQNITLGESGQFLSPYYRDQFDAWYNGRSFPMLFGGEAVEKGAQHKLILEPAGSS
jgi:penicillin G amidase